MNVNDIRKFIISQPFLPFEITLVDGRKFLIHHPDFVFAPPVARANWVIVISPDGAAEHINTLVISSVRTIPGGARGKRRRKAG